MADAKKRKGKIDHVFHCTTVYDVNMREADGWRVNVDGARSVVPGDNCSCTFTKAMRDERQSHSHPNFRTKF